MPDTNLEIQDEKCIFCLIARGDTPARIVYRDENCMAFWDAHPKAPLHLLIIPLQHIPSLNELKDDEIALLGHLFMVAAKLAAKMGVDQTGYRLMINTGSGAGQTVFHIHLHLLAWKTPVEFEAE